MTAISSTAWPQQRLVAALLIALGTVFALETLPGLREMVWPLQRQTALLALATIEFAGMPVSNDGIVLTHPDGFRVAISYGCTPLVPAIFLISLLTLGLSLTGRERAIALASGIVIVTFLNLFRVVALYYIGILSPGAFAFAHEWLGQGIVVLGTAIVVIYWIGASVSESMPINLQ